ncbi:MAG: hypothetical protein U0S12_06035 [Fimbriimonadales bacterium]
MTWSYPAGSSALVWAILASFVVGIALIFGMAKVPPRFRARIIAFFTFVAGLVYVLYWLWPQVPDIEAAKKADTFSMAVFLNDTVTQFKDLANTLTAFLLLIGVFSLVRMHVTRAFKHQKDWGFSWVLLISFVLMAVIGYWSFLAELGAKGAEAASVGPWFTNPVRLKDLLFDGLLQGMDAAMFSIIAFYILSAAYRAFRIRSVEATILLASALIVMLSLLGFADSVWNGMVDSIGGKDPSAFVNNFRLSEMATFIRQSLQVPGIRAIDFGIGVGALAMGLRLWLSLEKGGMSN